MVLLLSYVAVSSLLGLALVPGGLEVWTLSPAADTLYALGMGLTGWLAFGAARRMGVGAVPIALVLSTLTFWTSSMLAMPLGWWPSSSNSDFLTPSGYPPQMLKMVLELGPLGLAFASIAPFTARLIADRRRRDRSG